MNDDGRMRYERSVDGGQTWELGWANDRSIVAHQLSEHDDFIDGTGNWYRRPS